MPCFPPVGGIGREGMTAATWRIRVGFAFNVSGYNPGYEQLRDCEKFASLRLQYDDGHSAACPQLIVRPYLFETLGQWTDCLVGCSLSTVGWLQFCLSTGHKGGFIKLEGGSFTSCCSHRAARTSGHEWLHGFFRRISKCSGLPECPFATCRRPGGKDCHECLCPLIPRGMTMDWTMDDDRLHGFATGLVQWGTGCVLSCMAICLASVLGLLLMACKLKGGPCNNYPMIRCSRRLAKGAPVGFWTFFTVAGCPMGACAMPQTNMAGDIWEDFHRMDQNKQLLSSEPEWLNVVQSAEHLAPPPLRNCRRSG